MAPNAVNRARLTRIQYKKLTNVAIEPPDKFEEENQDDENETNPQYWSIRCRIPILHEHLPPKIVTNAKTIGKVGPRYHEEMPGRRGLYSRTKIEWFMVLHAWEEDPQVPGGKRTFLLLVPNTWMSDCWRFVVIPPDNFHYISAEPKTVQFYEHVRPLSSFGEYDIFMYVRKNAWRIAESALDFVKKASMVLPYDFMSDSNGDPYPDGESAETTEVDFKAFMIRKSLPSSPIRWAPEVQTITALRGPKKNATAAIKRAATNLSKGTEPMVRGRKRKVAAGKENIPVATKPKSTAKRTKKAKSDEGNGMSDDDMSGLGTLQATGERRKLINRDSKNDGQEKICENELETEGRISESVGPVRSKEVTVVFSNGGTSMNENGVDRNDGDADDKMASEKETVNPLAEQREQEKKLAEQREQERTLEEQREKDRNLEEQREKDRKLEEQREKDRQQKELAEKQRKEAEQVALRERLEADKQKKLNEDTLRELKMAEERRRREQHSLNSTFPDESPGQQPYAPTSESTPLNEAYDNGHAGAYMMRETSSPMMDLALHGPGGRRDHTEVRNCRRSLNPDLFNNGLPRQPYYPPHPFNSSGTGSSMDSQGAFDGYNDFHAQTGVRQNAATYHGGGHYSAQPPTLPPPPPHYVNMQPVRPSSSANVSLNSTNGHGGDSMSSTVSFAPTPALHTSHPTGNPKDPPTVPPTVKEHVCCFSREEAEEIKKQVKFMYERLYEEWEAKRKAAQQLTASETAVAKFPQHKPPFDLFSDLTNFCREFSSSEKMKEAFVPNFAAKISGMQFVGGKARKLMTLLVTPRLLCNCVFDRKNGLRIIGVDSVQTTLSNGTPTVERCEWREGTFNHIPGFKELFVQVLGSPWRGTVKKVLQQFRNNTKSRNDKAKLRPLEDGEEYKYEFTEIRDNDNA